MVTYIISHAWFFLSHTTPIALPIRIWMHWKLDQSKREDFDISKIFKLIAMKMNNIEKKTLVRYKSSTHALNKVFLLSNIRLKIIWMFRYLNWTTTVTELKFRDSRNFVFRKLWSLWSNSNVTDCLCRSNTKRAVTLWQLQVLEAGKKFWVVEGSRHSD